MKKMELDSLTLEKLVIMGHQSKRRSAIGRVNAIMILPDGKKPVEPIKEVIIHHADTNSFCGSIIFTKLPQIYFL